MMKIDRYIAELLFNHECVIVPGLGGFIINDRHASVDHITHQFNPPFKKILFNPHIRFNDGLLVNYIAGEEGLLFEAARKQIDELVHQYFTKLEKGEKIKFENVGVLAFDENNNITFDQDHTFNFNAESFGLGSFVSPPIKRKVEKEEPVKGIVQPQPVVRKREDRKPDRAVAEELKPIHKRENKSKRTYVRSFVLISLVAVLLTAVSLAYFSTENTSEYWQKITAALNSNKEKKHYTPRSEQNSEVNNTLTNQAGFLSGTIFEVEMPTIESVSKSSDKEIQAENNFIAGEISVTNYFNYRGRNLTEASKKETVETEVEVAENTVVENFTVAETELPVVKEEIVVNLKPASQYYIIAGSFSQESNAMSLIEELLQKGFSAQIIDTNKNGMYRVAYLGMENLSEAKQRLYAIREENNPEAWILKK